SRRGALVVDDGAAAALRHEDRSLLPAGIKSAEGDFQRGDIVSIRDTSGGEIACGMVNYDAKDVTRMKGLRSSQIQAVLGYHYGDEVVHRNNLVVL
ncbi:MAG TPA: PUA domain-containing protein, partial [Dehalococcoidia bacterium]|nr:PUA domain-containing protein [Dehalococcoidia bacterium]